MLRMRLTSRKMIIGLAGVLGVLAIVFVFGTVPDVLARVTGVCSNCHTMHNSQNGESVTAGGVGALNNLLKQDCAGCHSSSGSSTWKDPVTGAPIVYTIGAAPQFGPSYPGGPKQGLAGGNFYWVENVSDAKGHNVFLDNTDGALAEAPGRDGGCSYDGATGCHFSLAKQIPQSAAQVGARGRYGCTGCHMFSDEAYINGGYPPAHHADDTTTSVITSSSQGYYRYLFGHQGDVGVKGIEDANWEENPSAGRNEYLGDEELPRTYVPLGMAARNGAISGFCVGCHAKFHIEQDGSGMWIRHPADAVLPNSDEYAAAITLGDLVRVARPSITTDLPADRNTARPGKDMVMCLSCHRAHGSPYDDMLRWNYSAMTTGNTGAGGCFVCHTEKD